MEALDAVYRIQPQRRLRPVKSSLMSPRPFKPDHEVRSARSLLGAIGNDLGYEELLPRSTEILIAEGVTARILNLETLIEVKVTTQRRKRSSHAAHSPPSPSREKTAAAALPSRADPWSAVADAPVGLFSIQCGAAPCAAILNSPAFSTTSRFHPSLNSPAAIPSDRRPCRPPAQSGRDSAISPCQSNPSTEP